MLDVKIGSWSSLVPYSLKAVIKNKKTGTTLKTGNLETPPRYLSRLISRLPGLAFFILLCLTCTIFPYSSAQADDSCITCHTDEEMLTKSLGKDDKKKSEKQSGPG